uniref:Uncharacterized protein n=1 Tax=Acrobeloides nanus TaxID=290746 RepID=A0A914EI14_9BILA
MGKRWYENRHAKHTIMSTSSGFYALILTIFALVFELAHLLASEQSQLVRVKDLIMGAYMYGLGILFLCFCYYEIWARNRHRPIPQKVQTLIRLSTVKFILVEEAVMHGEVQ